jgi:2-keto-4-pentenoate hydratase
VSEFVAERLAAELRTAEIERRGVELPTGRFDGFSWADARATARARDALRRADGDARVGYKLGWTSAPMREALGIDQPNWGTLWESQRLPERVRPDRFIHAKVEPEIVYVAGTALTGRIDADDVLAAAAGWAVGLEVVDPRFPSFQFDWLDNTADNSSAAGIRTGEIATPDGDPAAWRIELTDGEVVRDGIGSAAMGSPAAAVAWLVGRLDEEDARLESGDLVYTGGLAAPFDVMPGHRYAVASPQLGEARFEMVIDDGKEPPCR